MACLSERPKIWTFFSLPILPPDIFDDFLGALDDRWSEVRMRGVCDVIGCRAPVFFFIIAPFFVYFCICFALLEYTIPCRLLSFLLIFLVNFLFHCFSTFRLSMHLTVHCTYIVHQMFECVIVSIPGVRKELTQDILNRILAFCYIRDIFTWPDPKTCSNIR